MTRPSYGLLLYILLLCGCQGEAPRPSQLPESGVTNSVVSHIALLDLNKTIGNMTSTKTQPDGDWKISRIPQESDKVNDGPRYYLWQPKENECFWIMVSGGYKGVTEWKGPAILSETNQIMPVDDCKQKQLEAHVVNSIGRK